MATPVFDPPGFASSTHIDVLLVESQPKLRAALSTQLRRGGATPTSVGHVRQAYVQLSRQRFDIAIIDTRLAAGDSLRLCQHVVQTLDVPVILSIAASSSQPLAELLAAGADDYVFQPCRSDELIARIHAVLRRRPRTAAAPVVTRHRFHGWIFDAAQRELTDPAGHPVPLSEAEARLLLALLRHPNTVLSRDSLLELTRSHGAQAFERSIDTQVSRLRKKLEADPRHPLMLKTAWGNGYLFVADVKALPA